MNHAQSCSAQCCRVLCVWDVKPSGPTASCTAPCTGASLGRAQRRSPNPTFVLTFPALTFGSSVLVCVNTDTQEQSDTEQSLSLSRQREKERASSGFGTWNGRGRISVLSNAALQALLSRSLVQLCPSLARNNVLLVFGAAPLRRGNGTRITRLLQIHPHWEDPDTERRGDAESQSVLCQVPTRHLQEKGSAPVPNTQ